jgi:hypothetical protein
VKKIAEKKETPPKVTTGRTWPDVAADIITSPWLVSTILVLTIVTISIAYDQTEPGHMVRVLGYELFLKRAVAKPADIPTVQPAAVPTTETPQISGAPGQSADMSETRVASAPSAPEQTFPPSAFPYDSEDENDPGWPFYSEGANGKQRARFRYEFTDGLTVADEPRVTFEIENRCRPDRIWDFSAALSGDGQKVLLWCTRGNGRLGKITIKWDTQTGPCPYPLNAGANEWPQWWNVVVCRRDGASYQALVIKQER